MTGDAMRDQLAAALQEYGVGRSTAPRLADALLPVVRKFVADELRAAADLAHDEYSGWEAANVVRARADALDPT